MNILVLGGNGFIGSKAVAHFLTLDHTVTVFSRSRPAPQLENVRYFTGDISDKEKLAALVSDASHIFYAAGATTPGTSFEQPQLELEGNLKPLLTLIEVLQALNSHRTLIYLSSAGALYTDRQVSPVTESTAPSPKSHYGAAKLAMEHFIETLTAQSRCKAIVLRPSNAYGPGQLPKRSFGIVPALFHASINQVSFKVWGNGSLTRDFIYIDDLLDVCGKILMAEDRLPNYSVFNVCSGETTSIRNLIQIVDSITPKEIDVVYQPSRTCDYPHPVISTESLQTNIGWRPTTTLDEGLNKAWQWYLEVSGL